MRKAVPAPSLRGGGGRRRERDMITREDARGRSGRPGDDFFEILVTRFRGVPAVGSGDDLNWQPATDVYETEDSFVVQMDLAGMDPSSIEVLSDGETLLVRGSRRDIAPPGKKHYFTMEISVGPFARRVTIPVAVKPETAEARYRSGFLFVSFARGDAPAGGDRRRIEVGDA